MNFDPDNPVIKLCVEGMTAEAEGRITEARQLFQQAWDTATNDFEAFTAAHYLARNQEDPNDNLKWNLEALKRSDAIEDDGMKAHYPSLYLNVAKSYETLVDIPRSIQYYELAADSCAYLPTGKYADMIRSGVAAGLKRVKGDDPADDEMAQLIYRWCERKDLKALAFVLPAYVSNLNTESDRNKLLSAFSYLSATKCLNDQEQGLVERIIATLSS